MKEEQKEGFREIRGNRYQGPVRIYRVQDIAGRGPYRPGYTRFWVDPDRTEEERPSVFNDHFHYSGLVAPPGVVRGTGFRTQEQLGWWFSPGELHRLEERNYYPVTMFVDGILAESKRQLLFYRRQPLAAGCVFCSDA